MALNTEPSNEGAGAEGGAPVAGRGAPRAPPPRPFPPVALGTPAACSGGSAPGAYAGAARPR
jgi:hypothetical protein